MTSLQRGMIYAAIAVASSLLAGSASAELCTDFENYAGAPEGFPLTGQQGWYIPSGTTSVDFQVFTYLTGRCANGAERDGGTLYHAVRSWRALCGAEPGRTSAGWSSHLGTVATCPRCLAKLARMERKADGKEVTRTNQA